MRNRHVFLIIAIFTIVATIAVLFFFVSAYARMDEAENKDTSVLTTNFVDQNGAPHNIKAFSGNTVLVNIWATWCSPCIKEMPALNKLQQDYADRGLRVITVSEDFQRDKAIEFLEDNNLDNLPRYFDVASILLRSYKVNGLPLSVLYNSQGEEIERFSGAVDWHDTKVRSIIESVLKNDFSNKKRENHQQQVGQ